MQAGMTLLIILIILILVFGGGGLIQTMKEVEELLSKGISAISTSNPQMWISFETLKQDCALNGHQRVPLG